MIDNKDIERYRSIKAPSELKARVMHACMLEERKRQKKQSEMFFASPRFIRGFSAVAACFVLVIMSFVAVRMASVDASLTYNGNEVTGREVVIDGVAMSAKAIVPVGIPLKVDAIRGTSVEVSRGSLYVVNKSGEVINCGTKIDMDKDTEIWWDAEGTDEPCYLTISTKKGTTEYILEFEDDTPNGVLYKNNNN